MIRSWVSDLITTKSRQQRYLQNLPVSPELLLDNLLSNYMLLQSVSLSGETAIWAFAAKLYDITLGIALESRSSYINSEYTANLTTWWRFGGVLLYFSSPVTSTDDPVVIFPIINFNASPTSPFAICLIVILTSAISRLLRNPKILHALQILVRKKSCEYNSFQNSTFSSAAFHLVRTSVPSVSELFLLLTLASNLIELFFEASLFPYKLSGNQTHHQHLTIFLITCYFLTIHKWFIILLNWCSNVFIQYP